MLEKLKTWFIVFSISFLVSWLGWAEQGKAFFFIYLGVSTIIICVSVAIIVIAGFVTDLAAVTNGLSFLVVLFFAASIAITFLVTWIISKVFGIDFYVAYQILTLLNCLFNKKNN